MGGECQSGDVRSDEDEWYVPQWRLVRVTFRIFCAHPYTPLCIAMDLKEFTSPGPKPWLAINAAYNLASASNGVSATVQPSFSSATATNIMPGDVPAAAISIPAGLCVAGMAFRVTVNGQAQTGSGGGHFRLYLAQDNGSVILSDNTDNVLTGAQNVPFQQVIDLSFSAVGAAGTASSYSMTNYSIIPSG